MPYRVYSIREMVERGGNDGLQGGLNFMENEGWTLHSVVPEYHRYSNTPPETPKFIFYSAT